MPIEYLAHLLCVCVMTSTDNISDAVFMCICMIICQQVYPPKQNVWIRPCLRAKYNIISVY